MPRVYVNSTFRCGCLKNSKRKFIYFVLIEKLFFDKNSLEFLHYIGHAACIRKFYV